MLTLRKIRKETLLIICIYLFVFEFAFTSISSIFGYWDEFYALLAFPLSFLYLNRKIKLENFILLLTLVLFIIVTLCGNVLYKYQSTPYILLDILSHIKFPLSILSTVYLFNGINVHNTLNTVKRQCYYIIDILFLLLVINYVVKIFPVYEIRFGLPAQQLFFGHPTALSAVSFFLLMLITLQYEGKSNEKFHIIILLLIILATLRIKAIVASVIYIYLYFRIIVFKRKFSLWSIIFIGIVAIMFGWNQINFYFLDVKSTQTARGALTYISTKVAKDKFPLGGGFGTFGSAASGTSYSPLYSLYGISHIWGLNRSNPCFVSDTFWPMILGQSGYSGLIIYILFLIGLLKKCVWDLRKNSTLYGVSLAIFLFLLISSTSESGFVNPSAVSFGFVLGLIILLYQQEEEVLSDL